MTHRENFSSPITFIPYYNQLRKEYKNKWVFYIGKVGERIVEAKSFNTYLQIYRIDGIDYSGIADISVKEFNNTLTKPFGG